jgi:hypothetical protein
VWEIGELAAESLKKYGVFGKTGLLFLSGTP